MLLSVAVVSTDASERYGKQLLSHLGRKVQTEPLPDRPAPAGRLLFAYGIGTVLPMPGQLVLRATAADQESLARVQDVLQRHLEKFGARRELAVSWGPVEPAGDDESSDGVASATTPSAQETEAARSGEKTDLAAGLDPEQAQQG
ncbi:MAG: DUF2218 domain-containing protein [Nakamurella sp.]